jgi:hypothetical protein
MTEEEEPVNRRMTTLGALALALLVLVSAPANAKGPNQVEVHDVTTGKTTLLTEDRTETWALMELVEWPHDTEEPRGIATGKLEHIVTLSWGFPDDSSPVWVDRLYSDGIGTTWVQRRDSMSGPATTSWGRIRAPIALEAVLASLDRPAEVPTVSQDKPATVAAPPPPRASADGWDGASFAWGAGSAGVLAMGLALGARWWRQRSVTASRKSRVSMPAAS